MTAYPTWGKGVFIVNFKKSSTSNEIQEPLICNKGMIPTLRVEINMTNAIAFKVSIGSKSVSYRCYMQSITLLKVLMGGL